MPDSGGRRGHRFRLLWAAAVTLRATSAPLASPASLGRSLAVLPLEAAGGGSREAGIAAGITSELTNAVSSVPGLRVTAQTAAVSARGRASTLPSIGVALSVSLLLEGSVQPAGERLRVTVRIVSVGNDSTVWVDRVEGSVGDTFAVQDAVSRAVVSALGTRLATADHRS